jgi:GTP-binding protein
MSNLKYFKKDDLLLNRHNAKFLISAVSPEGFPDTNLPEVAFVGRSNVGKSSLINALLNRKALAKVGGTPGKTRTINFFDIDGKVHLVDLPGYGYASVSRDNKKKWADVIENYLSQRSQLKLIMLLIDIRHSPTKDDKMMLQWIKEFDIPYIILATKTDKITKSRIHQHLKVIREDLNLKEEELFSFSSSTKLGVEEVWRLFEKSMD